MCGRRCELCVFADASLGPLLIQVVALVNDELSRHYGSGRYATMFFAEYDTSERLLRYVNAGQNPPVLLNPEGTSVAELTTREGRPSAYSTMRPTRRER